MCCYITLFFFNPELVQVLLPFCVTLIRKVNDIFLWETSPQSHSFHPYPLLHTPLGLRQDLLCTPHITVYVTPTTVWNVVSIFICLYTLTNQEAT